MVRSQSTPPADAVDDTDFSELPGLPKHDAAASTGNPRIVAHFLENGMSSAEFPQLEVVKPPSVSLNDDSLTDSLQNKEEDRLGRVTQTEDDCEKRADLMKNGRVSEEGIVASYTLNKSEDPVDVTWEKREESTELALGYNIADGGFGNHSVQRLPGLPEAREKRDKGMLLRLDSGYFNDDRSHWDLNSPMDSWEKQPGVFDADSEMDFMGKVAAGASYKRSLENLDGIQVHTLDVEPESKIRKAEQDMLSMGFQADQSAHGGMASESNTELDDTYFGLQADILLSGPWATSKKPMKRARVSKQDVQVQKSAGERGLNLCMAPSERLCYSTNDVSSPQSEDGKAEGEKLLDQDSEAQQLLRSDKQPDRPALGSKVYASDHIEHYPFLKSDVKQVKDNLYEIDGRSAKEISSGPQTAIEHFDAVVKRGVSSSVKDQHLVEITDENKIFHDGNILTICKADGFVSVKDTNTTRENPENPRDGLDKLPQEYSTVAAFASGYKHEDEDEPVPDIDMVLVGQMGSGIRAEDGGCRKAETRDWIEEDAGEEMEVGHVDYGDANCRYADDLGIDPSERGKDVDCMDSKNAKH